MPTPERQEAVEWQRFQFVLALPTESRQDIAGRIRRRVLHQVTRHIHTNVGGTASDEWEHGIKDQVRLALTEVLTEELTLDA